MNVTINCKQFEVEPEPADYWGWVQAGCSRNAWEAMDRYLRPEHTFVDLGAWIGSHSLYASTIAHRVVAFEPDPVAFAILERNIAGRRTSSCVGSGHGISAYQLAVTGHEGKVTLGSAVLGASTTRQNLNAGAAIGAATVTFEALSTTLRSVLCKIDGPTFIKMDIEGGEEELLQDFELFEKHKPILMLELHPFWWQNMGQMQRTLLKLSSLYPNAVRIDGRAGEKFNPTEDWPREVILAP